MKTKVKIISAISILVFILILLVLDTLGAQAILSHYFTNKKNSNLSFSFNSCKNNELSSDRILSQKWESNELIIKGKANPNCGATWLFGSYNVNQSNLELNYTATVGFWPACTCSKLVTYRIKGLKEKNYNISLKPTKPIEFKPILYELFFENKI